MLDFLNYLFTLLFAPKSSTSYKKETALKDPSEHSIKQNPNSKAPRASETTGQSAPPSPQTSEFEKIKEIITANPIIQDPKLPGKIENLRGEVLYSKDKNGKTLLDYALTNLDKEGDIIFGLVQSLLKAYTKDVKDSNDTEKFTQIINNKIIKDQLSKLNERYRTNGPNQVNKMRYGEWKETLRLISEITSVQIPLQRPRQTTR